MSSLSPTRSATRWEHDELIAQRIACNLLIKGCESALFSHDLAAGETGDSKQARIERRAAEIAREILRGWHGTLDALRSLERKQRWPDVDTLVGWLSVAPTGLSNDAVAASRAFFGHEAS